MCLYKHSQSDYSIIYIIRIVDLESSLSGFMNQLKHIERLKYVSRDKHQSSYHQYMTDSWYLYIRIIKKNL